jgi:quercetin dioxygenase-like cupin family protein
MYHSPDQPVSSAFSSSSLAIDARRSTLRERRSGFIFHFYLAKASWLGLIVVHGGHMNRNGLAVWIVLIASLLMVEQGYTQVVTSADQKFANFPNFPTCMTGAVLHGDPSSASGVEIIGKATAGCKVPWHFHTPNEQVRMISGKAKVEMKGDAAKMLTAGGYAYLPSKHQHEFTCVTACSLFVSADGMFDIHYVDSDGKEISLEQALKKK